jgi:hypothetical protein
MISIGVVTTKNIIKANTIKNNLISLQPDFKKNEAKKEEKEKKLENNVKKEENKCCECYNKETLDSRCCGLCFYCGEYIYCVKENKCCYNCITSDLEDKWCVNNPCEYFNSGLFLTSSGYGNEPDCFCTVFAGIVLCKFALTFPWLLCSMCNGTINCICETDKNYLF